MQWHPRTTGPAQKPGRARTALTSCWRLVLSPVEHADFGWLKPTAANLVTLRVNVPAGLHEVRLPAGATVDWAASAARTR